MAMTARQVDGSQQYVLRTQYEMVVMECRRFQNQVRELQMANLRVSAEKEQASAIVERQQGYIDRLLYRIEELTNVLKSFMARPAAPTVPVDQPATLRQPAVIRPHRPTPAPAAVVTPPLGLGAVPREDWPSASIVPDGWE